MEKKVRLMVSTVAVAVLVVVLFSAATEGIRTRLVDLKSSNQTHCSRCFWVTDSKISACTDFIPAIRTGASPLLLDRFEYDTRKTLVFAANVAATATQIELCFMNSPRYSTATAFVPPGTIRYGHSIEHNDAALTEFNHLFHNSGDFPVRDTQRVPITGITQTYNTQTLLNFESALDPLSESSGRISAIPLIDRDSVLVPPDAASNLFYCNHGIYAHESKPYTYVTKHFMPSGCVRGPPSGGNTALSMDLLYSDFENAPTTALLNDGEEFLLPRFVNRSRIVWTCENYGSRFTNNANDHDFVPDDFYGDKYSAFLIIKKPVSH